MPLEKRSAIHNATAGLYDTWAQLVANVGVPAAIAFFVLFQLGPRIDDGIRIADRVDGELNILAANCSSLQRTSHNNTVTPNP